MSEWKEIDKLLSTKNQSKSIEFNGKTDKLIAAGKEIIKLQNGLSNTTSYEEQIQRIGIKILIEDDPEKKESLLKEREELRSKQEKNVLLTNEKYHDALESEWRDLKELSQQAANEYEPLNTMITKETNFLREERDKMIKKIKEETETKIQELNNLRQNHPFNKAHARYNGFSDLLKQIK